MPSAGPPRSDETESNPRRRPTDRRPSTAGGGGLLGGHRGSQSNGLSQSQFEALLVVSVRTLPGWKQGRKQPSGAARTLLAYRQHQPTSGSCGGLKVALVQQVPHPRGAETFVDPGPDFEEAVRKARTTTTEPVPVRGRRLHAGGVSPVRPSPFRPSARRGRKRSGVADCSLIAPTDFPKVHADACVVARTAPEVDRRPSRLVPEFAL